MQDIYIPKILGWITNYDFPIVLFPSRNHSTMGHEAAGGLTFILYLFNNIFFSLLFIKVYITY